jgi:hypothetical protein
LFLQQDVYDVPPLAWGETDLEGEGHHGGMNLSKYLQSGSSLAMANVPARWRGRGLLVDDLITIIERLRGYLEVHVFIPDTGRGSNGFVVAVPFPAVECLRCL